LGLTDAESRTQRLASAVESSLVSTWSEFAASSPLVAVEVTPDATRYTTGAPFPILNGVLSSRIRDGDDADRVINSNLQYFHNRFLPMTWWTGPWSQPADLSARLRKAGLEEASHEIGMAMEPASLNVKSGRLLGFAIVEVEDRNAYRAFQLVLDQVFDLPERVSQVMYELVCAAGFGEHSKFRHYLGLKDGRAVATMTLSLAGGVAGIYNQATLKDDHAMGIHLAMGLNTLERACELEMPLAVVQSSRAGLDAFRSLGFEECGEVVQHVWRPPPVIKPVANKR
jgi:hypothetical protein